MSFENQGSIVDQSNNFNFYDCNITLQGSLNELKSLMDRAGHSSEAAEVAEVSESLQEIEKCTNPDEAKKSGRLNGLQRFMKKLADEKSSLGRIVRGVRNGISIAQDIAKGYNSIAEWVGWPQVPKPFLTKRK